LEEKSKPHPLHPFSFIPSATILQQNYVHFAVSLQTSCSHLLVSVNQILTLIKFEITKKKNISWLISLLLLTREPSFGLGNRERGNYCIFPSSFLNDVDERKIIVEKANKATKESAKSTQP